MVSQRTTSVERIPVPAVRRRSVLVLDDDRDVAQTIKDVIEDQGYRAICVGNGREALAILEQHPVQFVFTDLAMPVMTGTELLREMQARDQWRGIVRVVITTDGSDSRRHEADGLSVSVYVEKPFRPEEMRDVLTSLTPAS